MTAAQPWPGRYELRLSDSPLPRPSAVGSPSDPQGAFGDAAACVVCATVGVGVSVFPRLTRRERGARASVRWEVSAEYDG